MTSKQYELNIKVDVAKTGDGFQIVSRELGQMRTALASIDKNIATMTRSAFSQESAFGDLGARYRETIRQMGDMNSETIKLTTEYEKLRRATAFADKAEDGLARSRQQTIAATARATKAEQSIATEIRRTQATQARAVKTIEDVSDAQIRNQLMTQALSNEYAELVTDINKLAIAYDKAETQLTSNQVEQAKFARELEKTRIETAKATLAEQKLATERERTRATAARAQKAEQGLSKSRSSGFDSVVQKAGQATVALGSAGAILTSVALGIKTVFEEAERGANLQFAESKFDRLTLSIGETSDALKNELRTATKGLVSDAELVAGASQLIELGMAKTGDETVRLTRLVGGLGLDLEVLNLTLANNSQQRLDALGLSVEGVKDKMAELKREGAKGDLFDLAVIEGLEDRLELVGEKADSAAGDYQKLRVSLVNARDASANFIAKGINPAVELLASDYPTAIQASIDKLKELDEVTQAQKLAEGQGEADGFIGKYLTDFYKLNNDELQQLFASQLNLNEAYADSDYWMRNTVAIQDEMFEQLRSVFGETVKLERGMIMFQGEVVGSSYELVKLNEHLGELAQTQQVFDQAERRRIRIMQEVNRNIDAQGRLVVEAGERYGYLTASIGDVMLANEKYMQSVERGKAIRDIFTSLPSDLTSSLFQAQRDLEEHAVRYEQVYRNNAYAIADISQQLASDLTDEQRDAYSEILTTVDEGNAEWLSAYQALQSDLTESQRQALVAQRAELQNSDGTLATVYTGDAKKAEEAQERIEEANRLIVKSYKETAFETFAAQNPLIDQFGNIDESVLRYGTSLGVLNEEEIRMRAEIAQTTYAIADLNSRYEELGLTVPELTTATQYLIDGTASSAEAAAMLANGFIPLGQRLAESRDRAREAREALVALEDDYKYTVTETNKTIYETVEKGSNTTKQTALSSYSGTTSTRANQMYLVGDTPDGRAIPGVSELVIPSAGSRIVSAKETENILNSLYGFSGSPTAVPLAPSSYTTSSSHTEIREGDITIVVQDNAMAMQVNQLIDERRRQTRRSVVYREK